MEQISVSKAEQAATQPAHSGRPRPPARLRHARAAAAIIVTGVLLPLGTLSNRSSARDSGSASWDHKAAAAYLDQRTSGWMRGMGAIDQGTFCISCHTGLPYALARSALRADLGEREPCSTERQLLESVTKRVRLWKEVQTFLSGPTESGAPRRCSTLWSWSLMMPPTAP